MPATIQPTGPSGPAASPSTLRLLRERRGLTRKQVADGLGRSGPWLTKVEAGDLPVAGDTLNSYAAILDVRPDLLTTAIHVEPPEGTHFRSQKVSQRVRHQAVAAANLGAYLVNEMMSLADADAPLAMVELDADLLPGGAEEAAALVRLRLRLDGPIPDVAGALERFGIFVLPMPPGIEGIDAVTVRTNGPALAVVLLSEKAPEDRRRHTLAHELGHLVLDEKTLPQSMKDVETRADQFAGEFLAPYDEVRDDLKGITPSRLATLIAMHRHWGVSPSAFIRRARLHDDLTETQYRYWFRVLASRNILRGAGSAYSVRPAAMEDLLGAVKDGGYSVSDVLDRTHYRVGELADTLADAWPYHRPSPRLSPV